MTGTLDEVSSAIGGLQADVKNVGRNLDRVLAFMQESHKTLQASLDKHAEEDEQKLAALRNDINDLQSFRNRIYGIAAVVGIAASAGSQLISGAIKKVFS